MVLKTSSQQRGLPSIPMGWLNAPPVQSNHLIEKYQFNPKVPFVATGHYNSGTVTTSGVALSVCRSRTDCEGLNLAGTTPQHYACDKS
jgi:hypothetical protein